MRHHLVALGVFLAQLDAFEWIYQLVVDQLPVLRVLVDTTKTAEIGVFRAVALRQGVHPANDSSFLYCFERPINTRAHK